MTKVWLITGAARGFGARLADRARTAGDHVVAADVAPGEQCLPMDVTDPGAVESVVAEAVARLGRIDVLVNNAGLGLGGPFLHCDLAEARWLMEVNALGVMTVTRAVLPHMVARGCGTIVNVSSDSGRIGFPFQSVYDASKHAVEGFSEALRLELAGLGVRVCLVEPCGQFRTDMPREAVAAVAVPEDSPYAEVVAETAARMRAEWEHAADPDLVATAIVNLVAHPDPPLRTTVGPAERTRLVALRRQVPDEEFLAFLGRVAAGGGRPQAGVTGGELVVRELAAHGVTAVFGLVGGHNYEIADACADHGVRFVDVRHEQQAAHLADGWARFTRQVGVVTVDAAPGLVNALPGLEVGYEAQVPMLIAGSGVWWSRAEAELVAFAEATGMPVLTRNLARGILPEDHPCAVGFFPAPAALADAFLVVGTRLDWTIGNGRFPLFAPDAPVAQVDIRPEAIGKTRPVDVAVAGDAGAVLSQLTGVKRVAPSWTEAVRRSVLDARRELSASVAGHHGPIHSIQLVAALQDVLPRESITVVDGGYIAAFALQLLQAHIPGGVSWVGSTGHLGVGVAHAMAAKLAHPGLPVVALVGDGSFGLSGLEFDTAVRHGLPITVVVANDAGWGEIRDGQRRRFGRLTGSELNPTRYDQLAVALGGHGEHVEELAELRPALERALACGRPAVVDVATDRRQTSTAVSGLPWIYE
ncbi:SDR family NAD(P)-dependent oxidoreductase [Thermoactinospora rubra]|uniref:SDR family NAD(P)-dependent oxidoreductase n=1 Tax=Thermoactinospora rubra TaxID=1088767 RepID=UPI00117C5C8B|nr:SDR family NAD(P)-dependent oxidoreductase [Thermoactinospora rubra]